MNYGERDNLLVIFLGRKQQQIFDKSFQIYVYISFNLVLSFQFALAVVAVSTIYSIRKRKIPHMSLMFYFLTFYFIIS